MPLPAELEGAFLDAEGNLVVRMNGQERQVCHPKNWPSLQGEHNIENALAATVAAVLAGVPDDGLCGTLRTFQGLEGRQQTVREVDGITFVNDTNATSPEAVIAALKRFGNGSKHIVLIVGGKAKGFGFEEMAKHIREQCKHVVYLDGTSTAEIEQAVGADIPHSTASNMEDAVQNARAAAKDGDIVILSPGTASFGLFKNAYDRGGQFVEAVKNLK
jgi:UDP-N-acetylmuramoylalanine--D-glutamate ligase